MSREQWSKILTAAEIAAYHAETAKLDSAFAKRDCAFYQSRTIEQLRAFTAGAWEANDATGYQLARSYLALKGGA